MANNTVDPYSVYDQIAPPVAEGRTPDVDPYSVYEYADTTVAPPEERGIGKAIGRGVKRGGIGVAQGIAEVGNLFGSDAAKDWSGSLDKDMQQVAAYVPSYKDIDSVSDAGYYAIESIAEQLPNLAMLFTGAGVAGYGLKALGAGAKAAKAGAVAGAFGTDVLLQGGETAGGLRQEGKDPRDHVAGVVTTSLAKAGLDFIPIVALAKRMGVGKVATDAVVDVGEDMAKKGFLRNMGEGVALGVATEVPTEMAQSYADMVLSRVIEGANRPLSEEEKAELIDAGLKAGIVGGAFGAVAGANTGKLATVEEGEGGDVPPVVPPVAVPASKTTGTTRPLEDDDLDDLDDGERGEVVAKAPFVPPPQLVPNRKGTSSPVVPPPAQEATIIEDDPWEDAADVKTTTGGLLQSERSLSIPDDMQRVPRFADGRTQYEHNVDRWTVTYGEHKGKRIKDAQAEGGRVVVTDYNPEDLGKQITVMEGQVKDYLNPESELAKGMTTSKRETVARVLTGYVQEMKASKRTQELLLHNVEKTLNSWMKTFNPTGKLVFFGGNYDSRVPVESSASSIGRHVQIGDNTSLIHVNLHKIAEEFNTRRGRKRAMQNMYEALSHEYGHHLLHTIFTKETPEVRKALHGAFDELIWGLVRNHANPKAGLKEFMETHFTHGRVREMQKAIDRAPEGQRVTHAAQLVKAMRGANKNAGDYLGTADEVGADQIAKALSINPRLEADIAKLWGKLLAVLKRLYASLRNKGYLPHQAFDEWLTVLAKRAEETGTAIPIRDTKLPEQKPLFPNEVLEDIIDFSSSTNTIVHNVPRYTTKIMERLPKKSMIKLATLLSEMRRPDIRKSEKALFERILLYPKFRQKEFSRGDLLQAVIRELPILQATTITQHPVNTIGYTNLKLEADPIIRERNGRRLEEIDRLLDGLMVRIEQQEESIPVKADELLRWKAKKATRLDLLTQLETEKRDLLERMNAGTGRPAINIWRNPAMNSRDLSEPHFKEFTDYAGHTRVLVTDEHYHIAEVQSDWAGEPTISNKNLEDLYKLMVREEVRKAGMAGHSTIRMITAASAARFQKWGETAIAVSKTREMITALRARIKSPKATAEEKQESGMQLAALEDALKKHPVGKDAPQFIRVLSNTANTSIWYRYKNFIEPFIKKEYNGQEVTDAQGNTWIEFNINPDNVADQPVMQFSIVPERLQRSLRQVAGRENTEKEHPVNKVPEQVDRFNKFMKLGLTLLQIGKLNLHIKPLQNYIREVQRWFRTKTIWLNLADRRLIQWDKLGKDQAIRLSKMIYAINDKFDLRPDAAELAEMARLHKVGAEALQLYQDVMKDFDAVLDKYKQVRMAEARKNLRNVPDDIIEQEIIKIGKEFKDMKKRPFFPNARFGQFTIVVKAAKAVKVNGKSYKKGAIIRMETYEKENERNTRHKNIIREFKPEEVVIGTDYLSEKILSYQNVPVALLKELEKTVIFTKEQKQQLQMVAYSAAPGRSFVHHFQKKRGIEGYSEDTMRAYGSYMMHAASHIARSEHYNELNQFISEVDKSATKMRDGGLDATKRRQIAQYMSDHYDYIMNPKNEWESLRSLGFLWYLGFNVKSAAVNLTQIPLVAYPYLSHRFGDIKATKALTKAMKDTAAYWRDPAKTPDQHFAMAFERAKLDGFVDESLASSVAAVAEGSTLQRILPTTKAARMIRHASTYGAWAFQQAELWNRRIVFKATWDLTFNKEKNNFEEAYAAARDAVQTTQYEYAKWNRPEYSRGKRSVIFLFWQYLQHSMFFAFKGDPAYLRFWLMMGLFAGLQGLPGADDLLDMIDFAATKYKSILGYKNPKVDLRADAREFVKELGANPDLIMHGLGRSSFGLAHIGQMTGIPIPSVDLSGSLSLGRVIPGIEAAFATEGNFSDRFLRGATDIGGAGFAIPMSLMQTIADDNPDTYKRMERMLPSAMKGIARAARYLGDGEATTRTGATLRGADGQPVTFNPHDPQHLTEIIAQSLGATPTRVSQAQEANYATREVGQYYLQRRSLIMEQVGYAIRTGDREGLVDAYKALHQFNKTIPDPGLAIRASDLRTSVRARMKTLAYEEAGLPTTGGKKLMGLYNETRKPYDPDDSLTPEGVETEEAIERLP